GLAGSRPPLRTVTWPLAFRPTVVPRLTAPPPLPSDTEVLPATSAGAPAALSTVTVLEPLPVVTDRLPVRPVLVGLTVTVSLALLPITVTLPETAKVPLLAAPSLT